LTLFFGIVFGDVEKVWKKFAILQIEESINDGWLWRLLPGFGEMAAFGFR
jgi:hypothetical protein